MQTISFFYDDYKKVQRVLAELHSFGIKADATKLLACDADERYRVSPSDHVTANDAVIGAIIGGVAGVGSVALAALGLVDAAFLAPLLNFGVVTTLIVAGITGAAVGWASGSLTHFVHVKSKEPASGTLVTVQATSQQAPVVETILRSALTVSRSRSLAVYRDKHWSLHDSMAPAVPAIEMSRHRTHYLPE